jgi:hypothetical protein
MIFDKLKGQLALSHFPIARLMSRFMAVVMVTSFLGHVAFATSPVSSHLWQDVKESSLSRPGQDRWIIPDKYRLLSTNFADLDNLLSQATNDAEVVLHLPLPDGTLGRFRIVESPMMAPELAANFPEIKTYRGFGLDDPTATARFDRTPAGFHGVIFSVEGSVYIDPYQHGNVSLYVSYYKRDYGNFWGKRFEKLPPIGDNLSPFKTS